MLAGLTATEISNECVVGVCRQKVRRVDFDSATPIISPATFGVTPLHSPNWSSSVDNLEWVPETRFPVPPSKHLLWFSLFSTLKLLPWPTVLLSLYVPRN